MKIAVAGKGGAGKTTVSGTIARALGRAGHDVIAVDADVNPMLGISLGLGMDATERLATVRRGLDTGETPHEPTTAGMLKRFGADAPDGVRILVASRVEMPDSGCGCCGTTAHGLLSTLEDTGHTVLGDMEAGIGVLTRMKPDTLDVLLVVANPAPKSIEVARRAVEAAVARNCRVILVANRVKDADDLHAIRAVLGDDLVVIPEDPVIAQADAEGRAPIDVDPDAPGVLALIALSERLGVPARAA